MADTPTLIDLNKLPKHYKFEVKSGELPIEIESRLRQQEAQAANDLHQQNLILYVSLGVTVGIVASAVIALAVTEKPNLQNWATAIMTSVATGLVGYFTGRKTK